MSKNIKSCSIPLLVCILALSVTGLRAQEQKPSRFFYGGGVSVAVSDYLDIDISPRVGYYIAPGLALGVLAKYEYVNFKGNNPEPYKSNTYGGGAFMQYNISSLFSNQSLPFNIHAHTEYQYLYSEFDWKHQNHTSYYTDDRWYVGAGFSVPFGVKSYFYTTVLYDILRVIKNESNEYNKPVISVGVQF